MKTINNKINTRTRAKKISGIVFYTLTVTALIIIATYYIIVNLFGLTPVLSYYTILTDSMSPTANTGDMVFVAKADFEGLKQGDIISFYTDINLDGKKEIVTHYFASYITENEILYIKTHKANTTNQDSWKISKDEFIGKSFVIIPKLGKLTQYIKSPLGLITIAIDLVIIITAFSLIESIDTKKTDGIIDLPEILKE